MHSAVLQNKKYIQFADKSTVEGTKNAATDIIPNNMHEVVKNVVMEEHAYLYGFYWMSDAWLQSRRQIDFDRVPTATP